ncbi:ABC transporter permease [Prevotella sp.]
MNYPLFIARKIYNGGDKTRKVSKPAIRIATIGVAIGLAVMIISVSVVLGFKHSIRDKVIGFGSDITVADFLTLQGSEQYPIQINDSLIRALKSTPGIKHVQRYAYTQGILKTNDDFLGVLLKGVGPEFDSTFIHSNMIEGTLPKFSDSESHQKIVISKTIADKLNLKVGQRLFAYFINKQGVRTRKFTITGIYATNMKQFDSQICFTDLYTINKLNGWEPDQYSGAELQVNDFSQLNLITMRILNKVKNTVDHYGETYSAENITEMNPQIFSWLDLMDMNVWIILALMTAVAGVTMISGLLIIILEHTQMIGILKALGSRNRQIRHIFLWFSTFIIGRGLLLGNIIGLGCILLQKWLGLITLDPQTYYVSVVPVDLNIIYIAGVSVGILVVSGVSLILPSYLISKISPIKSIKMS